jgi:segregation and condensation protein B
MELENATEEARRRHLQQVVEGMIFASDEPLSPATLATVIGRVHGQTIAEEAVHEAVSQLNAEYAFTGRVFRIHFWSGGYRMATEPVAEPYIEAMLEDAGKLRLSRALLETLAILAYRQPVTKPEIDFVRGVDSDYSIRRLTELNLVDVVGRADSVGKPLLYGTTERFLDLFGLSDVDELPSLREIQELLDDPAFNKERARLLALEIDESESSPEQEPPRAS